MSINDDMHNNVGLCAYQTHIDPTMQTTKWAGAMARVDVTRNTTHMPQEVCDQTAQVSITRQNLDIDIREAIPDGGAPCQATHKQT